MVFTLIRVQTIGERKPMLYIDTPAKYIFHGKPIMSSHMISDTSIQELINFAVKIGLKRDWLQFDRKKNMSPMPHFDVMNSVYQKAVSAGAIECIPLDLVGVHWMNSKLREELYPGTPKHGNRWKINVLQNA